MVAPTRVNGGDVERDRGRARALADHDVDPEVLHRQVQHLLGGPGEAVDLVDEDDLALLEGGQHRRQVAGPLDRRAAGEPQRRAELGGDDHRDRGLAQAGRPGEQHVVRRAAAAQRAAQQQGQLLADPGLADEVVKALGPQRALDDPLVAVGERRDDTVAPRVVPLGSARAPVRSAIASSAGRLRANSASSALVRASSVARSLACDSFRRAARSAVATSGTCRRPPQPFGLDGGDRGLGVAGGPAEVDQAGHDLVAPGGRGPAGRARRPVRRTGRPARRGGPSARGRSAARPWCRCRGPS